MSHSIKFSFQQPIYVGELHIVNGFIIKLTKMPGWFHCKMAKLLLGWDYIKYKV